MPMTYPGSPSTLGHSRSRTVPTYSPREGQTFWLSAAKKPNMRRTGSHRVDPFLSIRLTLLEVMPQNWRSEQALHVLSKNIAAVSAGLFTAHIIEDCPLDRWGTEMLASGFDALGMVKDLVFIVDSNSSTLIIANSQVLALRISQYPNQKVVTFLTSGTSGDKFQRIAGERLGFLVNTLSVLSHSLANAFSHVVQLGDRETSYLRSESQLRAFKDWVQDVPVIYVSADDIGQGPAKGTDWEQMMSKERILLKIMLEGSHAGNDHVLDFAVPKSLFHLDSLAEPPSSLGVERRATDTSPFEAPLSLSCAANFTFRDLQDQIQTLMFDRLNGSKAASRLWADVSVMLEE